MREEMAGNKKRQRREREEDGGSEDALELKLYNDPWTIKKKLTESDVNELCRLILPMSQVEKYVLPFLDPKEQEALHGSGAGLLVKVKDFTDDRGRCYTLSFKQWKSNKTYKLGLNWISEIVSKKNLQNDDEIGMFWDNYSRCFCRFSVIERFQPVDAAIPLPPPDPSLCEFARKYLRLGPPMPEP